MVRKTGVSRAYLETERSGVSRISLHGEDFEKGISNWDDPLLLRSPDINFVFRIEETGGLTKILSLITGEHIGNDEKWLEYLRVEQVRDNPSSASIIIQTGCDNYCTFCIVPYTRGRETSRSIEDIVAEVTQACAEGAHEVTLLGQNVNSYGKLTRAKLWSETTLTWEDAGVATPFRELLNHLGEIPGLSRIRFTSSNPHDMTRDILSSHFEIPAVCPYLHFALQSGSDAVLARMNRKHTYADFKRQVEYLRAQDPLFAISTDIIVGYPGESETEFEETVRAMEELEFDYAFIARYSPRPGTRGATLTDDVSAAEKARRWNILNSVLTRTAAKRADLMIGRTEEILVTSREKDGMWSGRTRNFKEVYFESSEDLAGQLISVRIVRREEWRLIGEISFSVPEAPLQVLL